MILHNKFWNMISSNKYFFLKTSLHVLIESFNKKLFSTAIISIFVLNLNRLKESKISYYRLHSLSQIIYILIRSLQQVIILLILKKKSGKHVIFLVSLLIMFYQLNFVFYMRCWHFMFTDLWNSCLFQACMNTSTTWRATAKMCPTLRFPLREMYLLLWVKPLISTALSEIWVIERWA